MQRVFLWLAIAMFGLLSSLSVSAEQKAAAGYVSAVRGEVYAISAAGVARNLKAKSAIYVGEHIVTEAGGRVNIVFRDDSVLSLGQKSRGELTRYGWSEISERGSFEMNIDEGVFRVIGGKLTQTSPEKFRTLTPAATIGIRGSAYAGRVSANNLEVFLTSGKGIDVGNRRGSVALLKPGMGTLVSGGAAPAAPRLYSSLEIEGLLSELEKSDDPHTQGEMAGSGVAGVVINKAKIKDSTSLAVGKSNRATMGSVRIENSDISGTVINEADISDSANIAIGSDNEASIGSVVIE